MVIISNDGCQIDSVTTGASVLVEGVVASSEGGKQKVELKVSKITVVIISFFVTFLAHALLCL